VRGTFINIFQTLNIKEKVDNVTVLNNVIFTFYPEHAFLSGASITAQPNQIVIMDYFSS
jgi:hypothetical protein